MSPLGTISEEDFLKRYWQKKPCLIRGAFPGIEPVINQSGLFDLARKACVESRLVLEKDGEYPWQVIHGPLENLGPDDLPDTHWTLLVQGVNYHLDKAADLLSTFHFIPNWRIDDLMISYAVDGGGVGPHLDSYDVFLLQAAGSRRWQINQADHTENDFVPDLDMRIIADFKPRQEWVLEQGDMLYLPPGTAHQGTAIGQCMTYSIGFHAPDAKELLSYFTEEYLSLADTLIYKDPELNRQAHPGEIKQEAIEKLHYLLRSTVTDRQLIQSWLGKYLTRLPGILDEPSDQIQLDDVHELLKRKGELTLSPACRTAYMQHNAGFSLFINSEQFELDRTCSAFIFNLTEDRIVRYNTIFSGKNEQINHVLAFIVEQCLVRD